MDESETMQPFKPANMDDWEQLEGDICTPQKSGVDVPRGMKTPVIHLFPCCRAR
jgi:hypothetical protein